MNKPLLASGCPTTVQSVAQSPCRSGHRPAGPERDRIRDREKGVLRGISPYALCLTLGLDPRNVTSQGVDAAAQPLDFSTPCGNDSDNGTGVNRGRDAHDRRPYGVPLSATQKVS